MCGSYHLPSCGLFFSSASLYLVQTKFSTDSLDPVLIIQHFTIIVAISLFCEKHNMVLKDSTNLNG